MGKDVVIIGGGGHVGLPLALAFADAGLSTVAYDINSDVVETVQGGQMPFLEEGADPVLRRILDAGTFEITADPGCIRDAEAVVIVIGTPVDDHLNPDPDAVIDAVREILPELHAGQLLVLRSTVYPGVTRRLQKYLDEHHLGIDIAFCPERIAQGKAMTELFELPQIVGASAPRAAQRAAALFKSIAPSIVETTPEEAELAKLFTNVWRYMKFAAANEFFMMANDAGVDFARVRAALSQDYPRADDMPGPGFAAGPCLLKDTLQLAAFEDNKFALGNSAMMVNEGLPLYLVKRLQLRYDLAELTIGIAGMAFKAETDDPRASLSYKLRKILKFRAANVLASDPFVVDERLVPIEELLASSDVIIVGAPHAEYRSLDTDKPVIDVWNLAGNGVLI
ncbi:MAG: nucleotide sugar dehydrogenase [Candidatus Nanopelagicales bacterium]